jgi:SRSO17 transposase
VTEQSARSLLRRFGQFADHFAPCVNRRAQRDAASQYLDGLFNDSERKSMQAMHGRLGDPGSYEALQHFITDSPWDAAPLWTRLRALVPSRRGILAVDDTSFPKQGHHSVGVQRQYCGALGKIANCQVAVSTVLLDDQLAWPLSVEVYLPQAWCTDAARRSKARLPSSVRFREKWRIALTHIRHVLKGGFTITAVVADADYGARRAFRRGLERLGLRYGIALPSTAALWAAGARRTRTAAAIGGALAEADWQRVSWADGTTGPLVARFAAVRVRPAKSRGDRWLLCERSLADDARKYYLLNLEATASLRDLVTVARSRWPIEQQYRELKGELGIDHFEGRSYAGWTHHTVLTAIAFTFLQLERQRSGDDPRPTLPTIRLWVREIIAVLYVVTNRKLLNLLVSFQQNPPLRR